MDPSPSQFTIEIPPKSAYDSCDLRVEAGGKSKQWRYTYETDASRIPSITISETSPLVYNVTLQSLSYNYYNFVHLVLLDSQGNPTSTYYNMDMTKVSNTEMSITPENNYLGVGTYAVRAHTERYGYAVSAPSTIAIAASSQPSVSGPSITSSFAGGKKITLSGSGYHVNNIENNEVTICGQKAEVIQASETNL